MRIILYTGKGGVGKTTVAAATALSSAGLGHRTLVISTDPAHSLADAFDRRLGADPTPIHRNLWGQEINVLEEIRANWGEVARYLAALFASEGVDEVVAEEMAVLPGTDELCGLLQIRRHASDGLYGYTADAVVNNRVFPDEPGERILSRWRRIQARYGEQIRHAFAPLPVWEIPFFDQEVVGLPMLARMAEALFARRDPLRIYATGPVQTLRKDDERYTLSLRLPFVGGKDVALDKMGDEVVISVGNFRRALFLPRALASATVEEARLEADWLHVRLRPASGAPAEKAARARERGA